MFVSLDGLDGAGKSTQCRRLADWLRTQGRDVVECADPGGTHVGQVLRQVLLDPQHPLCLPAEAAFLFMASRARKLVADVIRAGSGCEQSRRLRPLSACERRLPGTRWGPRSAASVDRRPTRDRRLAAGPDDRPGRPAGAIANSTEEGRRPDGATRRRVLLQGASGIPRRSETRAGADRRRRRRTGRGCGACGHRACGEPGRSLTSGGVYPRRPATLGSQVHGRRG